MVQVSTTSETKPDDFQRATVLDPCIQIGQTGRRGLPTLTIHPTGLHRWSQGGGFKDSDSTACQDHFAPFERGCGKASVLQRIASTDQ